MPEGLERMSKRVRYSTAMEYSKEDEDEIYGKKIIMDFTEIKKEKVSRQDALVSQVKKSKKLKQRPTVKKRKVKNGKEEKVVPILSNEVTKRLKEYIDEMNGKEVKMVIQKPLFPSDLKTSQNRLSMPINQLKTEEFLTKDEKQHLDAKLEFEVKLLGPRLKMHNRPMVMKKWHMEKSDNYVLKTNWNDFVRENKKDLKEKSMIQVWSFRKDEKLHFAIACLENDVVDVKKEAPVSSIPIHLLPPKKRWKFLQCSQ